MTRLWTFVLILRWKFSSRWKALPITLMGNRSEMIQCFDRRDDESSLEVQKKQRKKKEKSRIYSDFLSTAVEIIFCHMKKKFIPFTVLFHECKSICEFIFRIIIFFFEYFYFNPKPEPNNPYLIFFLINSNVIVCIKCRETEFSIYTHIN